METEEYDKLKSSFEKLALNDSALVIENEHSAAMGHGFRCGFLGMLHMDIVKERLVREYGLETLFTTPTVTYLIKMKNLKDDRILSGSHTKELLENGFWKYLVTPAPGDEERSIADLMVKYGTILKPRIIVHSG